MQGPWKRLKNEGASPSTVPLSKVIQCCELVQDRMFPLFLLPIIRTAYPLLNSLFALFLSACFFLEQCVLSHPPRLSLIIRWGDGRYRNLLLFAPALLSFTRRRRAGREVWASASAMCLSSPCLTLSLLLFILLPFSLPLSPPCFSLTPAVNFSLFYLTLSHSLSPSSLSLREKRR
ncbi:MAG: hypothetical protein JOS17DRAFT_313161 [Linnemannia elongata]|nr:MAG: hypothetical protein JOS17DRAFT_313161 [Linnemannia elongata]